MNFTSLVFWVFLAIVLFLYWLVRDRQWQNSILLIASYIFYGWIHPWLAIMLGISTAIDFFLAKAIQAQRITSKKRVRSLMAISLILNLGVLSFFKYYTFFSADLAQIANSLGIEAGFILTRVLLPAGLSFYTLKKLGYMIDIFKGTLKPTPSLTNFALYVSFFPQLVAGPIDRPQKLLPQIESTRLWKLDYFFAAYPLILMGLFKKIVIADSLSSFTQRIFHVEQPTVLLAIAGAMGFTIQILADFSAYTDLSRGVALLLGFETSENFRSPYLSLTPTEFWNRWHITLSSWLRDYVFFPVRRYLMTKQKQLPLWLVQAIPPMLTMLISGIWHGAGWTYILWGGMYGFLIVLYQAVGMGGNWKPRGHLDAIFAWLSMFSFIVFGWLLFAAPSLTWVAKVFAGPIAGSREQQVVALIGFSLAIMYSIPMIVKALLDRFVRDDSFVQSVYYAIATAIIFFYINSTTPDFIYFQF